MERDGEVGYITRPWGIRKVLWMLVVIGGIVLSGRDIWISVEKYLRKPTNTITRLQYPNEVPFPQLILCNGNQFRITEAQKDLYDVITAAFGNLDNRSAFQIEDYTPHLRKAIKNMKTDRAYVYRMRAAHQADDMILKCRTWDGGNCEKSFTQQIYDNGVCQHFNGSSWSPVTQPGSGQSLTMYLNLESYQHMQGPAQFLNSLKVTILDKDVFPYVAAKGFDISPGYMTMVSLRYREVSRVLSADGGACVEKRGLKHFEKRLYSSDTCQLDLVFQKIENQCQCKPYETPGEPDNVTYCDLVQHFNCVMWQDLSVKNAASQCNQACSTVEYLVSLSHIKISPSIWPVLLDSARDRKIKDAFNASQEAVSRNDQERVKKLKNLVTAVENASLVLQNLGMEPPGGDNVTNDARHPFDTTAGPLCYDEVKERYKTLLKGFIETGLTGGVCTYGSTKVEDGASRPQSTSTSTCADKIGPIWRDFYPTDQFITNSSENATIDMYNNEIKSVFLKFMASLAGVYASPWCLAQPSSMKDYWEIVTETSLYYQQNITLKEWLDKHSTGTGERYKVNYANSFTNIYLVMQNGLADAVTKSKNITEVYANRSQFWTYFGIYMGVCHGVYNKSACLTNVTAETLSSTLCTSDPFLSFDQFYIDSIDCANGDLASNLSDFKIRVEKAADQYKSAVENLDDFLLSYGKQWEFGDNFFSNNIVGLKVFFADLSQEIVNEEIAYDISNLFGDMGGSIGLFIGASVLSFFEFLDQFLSEMPCVKRLRSKFARGQAKKPNHVQSSPDPRAPTLGSLYGKQGTMPMTAIKI